MALTPAVKSLDKFLLFSEKVVGPGSLTNFGILPGLCGVLRNWAGAAGPRPVEVFLPLIQEAPGAQAGLGTLTQLTRWMLAPPGGCPRWPSCACWPGSGEEAPFLSRSQCGQMGMVRPGHLGSLNAQIFSLLRPQDSPLLFWSDFAWCVCLLACVL